MNTKKAFLLTLAALCIISALLPGVALAEGPAPITHTVTFIGPEGSPIPEPVTVADGAVVPQPAGLVWDRHQFNGWFADAGCTTPWDFNTAVTGDITLYAGWLNIFTVTVSVNGAFGTVSGSGDFTAGSQVTLTAAPSAGYRFVKWAENGVQDPAYSFTVTQDVTLTAVFEAMTVPSLSASSLSYKSVSLTWTPVPGAAGYQLYRATKPNGRYSLVKTFKSGGILSYTNASLKTNTTYYYKIRSYSKVGRKTYYSSYSQIVSVAPTLTAPGLGVAQLTSTSIHLTWNALPNVSGYEVYHSTSENGTYAKVYTAAAKATVFDDMGLAVNTTYYFKVRAYIKSGSKKLYGPFSPVQSIVTVAIPGERIYSTFYQGDPAWGFNSHVRNTACLMTAYADVVNNMGKGASPRTVFDSNGGRTIMSFKNLSANFGVNPVCALDTSSPYYSSFNGVQTFIKDPEHNAITAIKQALDRHPEGVICYFVRGSRSHAIVASMYSGDLIYYSDPGRNLKKLVGLSDTWVSCHHRMSYKNLSYIAALD